MEDMIPFITTDIERSYKVGGLTAGQAKYRAYFIVDHNGRYDEFKTAVDGNLMIDGYGNCIVTE